jgi:hypothetical protein
VQKELLPLDRYRWSTYAVCPASDSRTLIFHRLAHVGPKAIYGEREALKRGPRTRWSAAAMVLPNPLMRMN